jgi:thioredoxin reductase
METLNHLPVAILGAGPVGLAAAAELVTRRQPFIVLEAGSEVGAAVRAWGHVAMFSPWRFNVSRSARRLLEPTDWVAPELEGLPTGDDLIDRYLAPLSRHEEIAPFLRLNARVRAVGRKDFDKVRTKDRDRQPFAIHLDSGEVVDARAVIDATGTWNQPNPSGSNGHPVPGEREWSNHVAYGIPAILGSARSRYVGKRVMVVGSGHSAINVVLDLLTLGERVAGTDVVWVMRRDNLDTVWGGGAADALAARGLLGARAKQAVEAGRLDVRSPYRIRAMAKSPNGLAISGVMNGRESVITVDEVIVATGFRPDLEMLREIRLSNDPWLECTSALGPLIDPNEHSCGTVRPHGARELAHPEKDFFVVGMKSYGRAPTFLLATGYEQVRSVAALLAGDVEAAERVELELPETGVCSAPSDEGGGCCGTTAVTAAVTTAGTASPVAADVSGCCGGPAPADVDACCVQDADAKAAGEEGCGCGTAPSPLLQIGGAGRR